MIELEKTLHHLGKEGEDRNLHAKIRGEQLDARFDVDGPIYWSRNGTA